MRFVFALTSLAVFAILGGMLTGCGGAPEGEQGLGGSVTREVGDPGTESLADKDTPTAQVENEYSQQVCPVMGRKVSRQIFTDYQGRRIYFCCPPCVKTFKSDPEKYMAIMKEQGMEPELLPSGEEEE